MFGQIDTLCQRDLQAYFTKISWPKKLYSDPIPQSESYTAPHLVPNPCISDSDDVAMKKAESVIKNNFMAYYLSTDSKKNTKDGEPDANKQKRKPLTKQ